MGLIRGFIAASLDGYIADRDGDAWVVGGAKLQAAFIAGGALDRLELFVIPVLLGCGVPLFPTDDTSGDVPPRTLNLRGTRAYTNGMVQLSYEFPPLAA